MFAGDCDISDRGDGSDDDDSNASGSNHGQ
jgi:hypothetical protein